MKRPKMTRVVNFRVTEEDWLEIQRAASDCGEPVNEWCRILALETIKMPVGLTPSDRILFSQIARAGFLLENGFQLLADETLESEHWKRYRNYALANLARIANQALAEVQSNIKSTGSS